MSDPIYTAPIDYGGPEDKTMTIVVYALYLMGFLTGGLTTLIGLIMAYVLKSGAGERAYSHYVFQIRTFWISLIWLAVASVLVVLGIPLAIILVGIPLLILAKLIIVVAAVWYGVRCVMGLIAAVQDQPYGRPRAWVL
ncbi:MAG: hypothetical protein WA840_01705 [Caulobacteraceae bacterium]